MSSIELYATEFNKNAERTLKAREPLKCYNLITEVIEQDHVCSALALGQCATCKKYLAIRNGEYCLIGKDCMHFDFLKELQISPNIARAYSQMLEIPAPQITAPPSPLVLTKKILDVEEYNLVPLKHLESHPNAEIRRKVSELPAIRFTKTEGRIVLDHHAGGIYTLTPNIISLGTTKVSKEATSPIVCKRKHLDDHECPPCQRQHLDEHECTICTEAHLAEHSCAPCPREHLDTHECPRLKCLEPHLTDQIRAELQRLRARVLELEQASSEEEEAPLPRTTVSSLMLPPAMQAVTLRPQQSSSTIDSWDRTTSPDTGSTATITKGSDGLPISNQDGTRYVRSLKGSQRNPFTADDEIVEQAERYDPPRNTQELTAGKRHRRVPSPTPSKTSTHRSTESTKHRSALDTFFGVPPPRTRKHRPESKDEGQQSDLTKRLEEKRRERKASDSKSKK